VGFPSDVKTSKFSFTRKICTFYNRLGHTVDEDQVEEVPEAQAQVRVQAQPISSTSFMRQRITRSKDKALGDEHQWMSLFVISFE